MTPVAGVNDFDADQDADFALITEYVTHRASPEAMRTMNHRYRTEPGFRAKADPIIAIWTLPFLAVELTEAGEAIVQPAKDRFAKESCQDVWDGFHADLGLESIPVDVIHNDNADPILHFPSLTKRPGPSHSRWGRRTVILMTAVASAVSGALVMKIREAWPVALADYYGGRALAPGAPYWRPTTYQTAYGQALTVALPTADVHLNSLSRLSIGWKSMGAIDGEAEILVHPGKLLQLWVGDDPFTFGEGVFLLAHPLGPTTRLTVVKGAVKHGDDIYRADAVITAESRGTKTTFRAREGGRERPEVTVSNHAMRP